MKSLATNEQEKLLQVYRNLRSIEDFKRRAHRSLKRFQKLRLDMKPGSIAWMRNNAVCRDRYEKLTDYSKQQLRACRMADAILYGESLLFFHSMGSVGLFLLALRMYGVNLRQLDKFGMGGGAKTK